MRHRDYWKQLANEPGFDKVFALSGLLILLSSTIYWAILGARIQQHNADQLVNALLFENSATFGEALFPGSHTFLFKWPLFLIERLLGLNDAAYMAVTLLSVLATVGALAYLLYRIDRRPLVFGTVCLALSSILMLVPIESAPGALLPVNMAMLATRNLEYIMYIGALLLILRRPGLRSPAMWMGLGLLALLVASDKLFLSLAAGGALLGVALYAITKQKFQAVAMSWWLGMSILSTIVAAGIIRLLQPITNIAGTDKTGPYQLIHSAQDFVIGTIYAAFHILTNFGANPAGQELVLRDIPGGIIDGLASLSGVSYFVNLGLLAFCVWGAYSIFSQQIRKRSKNTVTNDNYAMLVIALLLSTVTALGAFVVTKHYYAGDARYLAISFFALIIAGAVYARGREFSQKQLLVAGAVCLLSTIMAMPAAEAQADRSQHVYATYDARNRQIARSLQTLQQTQPVTKVLLVGDYWRVIPIKQDMPGIKVTPLSGCTDKRSPLSSEAWKPDLGNTKFTYLLSLDDSLTDYPRCSLEQVIQAYGQPTDAELIAGSKENPKELLLYYDKATDKHH